jgi:hypothetical protein
VLQSELEALIGFLRRLQALWDAHRWEGAARKAIRAMNYNAADMALQRAVELREKAR